MWKNISKVFEAEKIHCAGIISIRYTTQKRIELSIRYTTQKRIVPLQSPKVCPFFMNATLGGLRSTTRIYDGDVALNK
jgi:hypothetical protein